MNRRTEHQALLEALPAIEAVALRKRVRHVSLVTGLAGSWLNHLDQPWGDRSLRWEIEPEPATRPLTADEALDELWGKVIVRKSDGAKFGVSNVYSESAFLCGPVGHGGFLYDKLHTDYTYENGGVIGKPL